MTISKILHLNDSVTDTYKNILTTKDLTMGPFNIFKYGNRTKMIK